MKIGKTMKSKLLLFMILHLFFIQAFSQIRVALGDFSNRTSSLPYLDQFEKEIPEFLKSSFSQSKEIVLIERQDLKAIMAEQALSMSGLMDSSNAQMVGKLVEAEYIITGFITEAGNWIRIDAKIIRVSTGLVISEMVRARSIKNISEMTELLAHNLIFRLTGENEYKEKIVLKRYPTFYFFSATVLSAAATTYGHITYNDKRQKYSDATKIDDFNTLYNSANRWNKARYTLAATTGTAFLGMLYCWLKNRSPQEIQTAGLPVTPYVQIPKNGEYAIGIKISF